MWSFYYVFQLYRWAMSEGYGACLIKKPDIVYNMVRQTRNRVQNSDFTVSIKIRIHDDIRFSFILHNYDRFIVMTILADYNHHSNC